MAAKNAMMVPQEVLHVLQHVDLWVYQLAMLEEGYGVRTVIVYTLQDLIVSFPALNLLLFLREQDFLLLT